MKPASRAAYGSPIIPAPRIALATEGCYQHSHTNCLRIVTCCFCVDAAWPLSSQHVSKVCGSDLRYRSGDRSFALSSHLKGHIVLIID